jgi:hypothetical protein
MPLDRLARPADHLPAVSALPTLIRPVLLTLSFLLAACSEAAQTRQPADDCTLATELVPGIPGSPGHLIKSTRNPNGDSEHAVLMRLFVDDLREARVLLEAGQPVKKLHDTHRKMRCAWPTRPEERNVRFDSLAQGYLAAVRAFDAAPQKANYNAIIQGCIACHSTSCGGPLDFIDGMKWQ